MGWGRLYFKKLNKNKTKTNPQKTFCSGIIDELYNQDQNNPPPPARKCYAPLFSCDIIRKVPTILGNTDPF